MPAVTPLPTPSPTRGDTDALFTARADALLAAFPLMVTEINAAIEAMNLNSTNGTSATSMLIGTGSKTFVTQTGKSYVPGQTIKVAYTTDPTKWMLGDVTAYNTGTGSLTVFVQFVQGSGTFGAWTLSLSAPAPVTIPTGSKILFYNSVAPTGWTQDTAHNNKALRVVSGAGGVAAGSVDFTTAFASQAVTGSNSSTTLTKAMIPTHVHAARHNDGAGSVATGGSWVNSVGNIVGTSTGNGAADGLSGTTPHTHPFTGTAINLAVKYLDMILATKD